MTTFTDTCRAVVVVAMLLMGVAGRTTRDIGTSDQASCSNPTVTEGQPGEMTFNFGRDIDQKSEGFFIYLRRDTEPETDIMRCERLNPVLPVHCKAEDNRLSDGSLTNKGLTVMIPKTVKDLQDNYTLQVYEKNSPLPPMTCTLTVTDKRSHSESDGGNEWIAAPVIIVIIIIALVIVFVVYILRKRKRRKDANATRPENESHRQNLLHHGSENSVKDDHTEKRWFLEKFTTEDKKKLLKSGEIKEGSFLITFGRTNPEHFLLTVFMNDVVKQFPIERKNDGFLFLDTKQKFGSLADLVDYHKKHKIQVGDTVWGRLSKPFRNEPEEEWYFGKFTREDEDKLLQTTKCAPGSFLIRDGVTDPDDYVLVVCFEDEMKHFTIIDEDEGFHLRDTGEVFSTLTKLLDFYKKHPISVGGKEYGKLSTAFKKSELDQWYLENSLTARDDNKFLSSSREIPGSYLIAPGSTNPNRYILAVYFDGVIKRLTIDRKGNRYDFLDTGKSFRTLPELVNHYKAHDLAVGNKVLGKLTVRVKMKPEEDWYFGQFTRKDEDKLLESGKHALGSFLIRDGVTDPDNYVLAVYCDGKINHFTIIPEENGFRFRDTDKVFGRLSDLVAHFTENTIRVDDKVYCKLAKPFDKKTVVK